MEKGQKNAAEPQAGEPKTASTEQAADLAALEKAAGAEIQGEQAAQLAQSDDERGKLAKELAGMVGMFVPIATPMLPSLGKIYTPETIDAAANAAAAVCVKHGWLENGVMDGYGEEITAVVVLGPLAIATYHGVRSDLAALETKKPEPGKRTELEKSEPGSKDVRIGAAIVESEKGE